VQKVATERSMPLRPVRTLLLWLVLTCWLPAAAGIAVLFFHMYQDGRAQLEKTTIETARALVQVVDGELMRAQAVALALASSDSLARHDFAALHRHASVLLQTTEIGTNVVLTDENGRQLVHTLRAYGEALTDVAIPPHIRSVFITGKPQISNVFRGAQTGNFEISIDVPVLANGKVAYVLSVGFLSQQLNQILRKQHLPSDWVAGISDRVGSIVARSHAPEQFVGKTASLVLVRHMLAGATPEGSIEAMTSERIPSLIAYSRSAFSQWCVAIAIPRHSLEADLMRSVYLLVLAIALLFGASVGLAWVVGGRISRSVQALTAPAIALEAGKAMAPVSRVYFREADEVAKTLARTALRLEQHTQALDISRESLEKSEKYYRTIMTSVMDNIIVLDDSGRITYINHVSPGFTSAQVIGSDWIKWLEPADQAAAKRQLLHTLATNESATLEMSAVGINRQMTSFQVNFSSIPSFENKQVVLIARDITEIKQAGADLLHSRTKLRKLVKHQDVIKEAERKRIARDIHDDLGQNLLVLRIDMSIMAARPNLDAVIRQQIDSTLKQIDITIKAVKDIINELRPAVLSLGLHAAIEWQAKEFERRTGITCEFSYDNDEFPLHDNLATSLFRIVQESLANIVRHAKARHCHIMMRCRDGQLFMTISDDGVGLSPNYKCKENTFGLVGIEERIDSLGGTFSISNNPERGAAITVSIPFAIGPRDAPYMQGAPNHPAADALVLAGMPGDRCTAA
jgi:PAS domain S-box-containing protein